MNDEQKRHLIRKMFAKYSIVEVRNPKNHNHINYKYCHYFENCYHFRFNIFNDIEIYIYNNTTNSVISYEFCQIFYTLCRIKNKLTKLKENE